MWGTFLSEPLLIVALVGRYPANKLIRRIPISCRPKPLVIVRCHQMTQSGINPPFGGLFPNMRQVGYALLTRAPVAITVVQAPLHAAPRLACVKPVASVHPEPGSNSTLYICISLFVCFQDAYPSSR